MSLTNLIQRLHIYERIEIAYPIDVNAIIIYRGFVADLLRQKPDFSNVNVKYIYPTIYAGVPILCIIVDQLFKLEGESNNEAKENS